MFGKLIPIFVILLLDICLVSAKELLVVTVATKETDGFRRFMNSAKKYDLPVLVVGMGEEWDGGDVARFAGGGHKLNLLKEALAKYADREDLILLYTDSYDVVFTNGTTDIMKKYDNFNARVIFSAEGFCWPDHTLSKEYPTVGATEKRFLNSGGYIGVAKDIVEILNHKKVDNRDDDQLYFTKIFLDKALRLKWDIRLDTKSLIFQNLNGALGEVMLKFKGSRSFMYNVKTRQVSSLVHGNGPIKPEFNRLANYLVDGWTKSSGCLSCNKNVLSLADTKLPDYPNVMIAIFVESSVPFIEEFFEKVYRMNYPTSNIDLFIHNSVDFHKKDVEKFVDFVKDKYRSVHTLDSSDNVDETSARNWAIEGCLQKSCKYLFSLDPFAHMDNPDTLRLLIEQNRTILAPMLARIGKFWSNFWGAVSSDGYYARSEDYLDIVEGVRRGVWNVPYISQAYLIQGHVLPELKGAYSNRFMDADMAFTKTARDKGIFMFVSNLKSFGHLVNADHFDTIHKHNELWQLYDNPSDWEARYIHVNYTNTLKESTVALQPCPDVYWFPVFTEKFCDELIEEMENHGQWSNGKNEDPRLAGGYENVPTVDIHMRQINYEKEWLSFLHKYVTPLQKKVFIGYNHEPPQAIMNFVVRYQPHEQPLLRPHHDSSTFTINIALNHPHIDYEGGGVHFLRYNCKVLETRKGWVLMHPGRLTHFHEGLRVTKGIRYIMISFVDP